MPDGLTLRPAQPGDLDQIAALLAERGEPADAVDHQLVMADTEAGYDSCAVVVDEARVVATATLLDETLTLGGVEIAAGQVDLVATHHEYEGRGLARALMNWAHERSARRGHLVQVMVGIPNFYRQFGYEYAIPQPKLRAAHTVPPRPHGYELRLANPADIPAMAALQETAQRRFDVAMPHSAACWRWLVARPDGSQVIVERSGSLVAAGRITPSKQGVAVLAEMAATDLPAAHALLGLAGARSPVKVKDRPGTLAGDALEPFLEPRPRQATAYYVRVPDVVALLDHLRPLLSRRLAAASGLPASGEAVISFFKSHVRLSYAGGQVVAVAGRARRPSPDVGATGVAPDLVAHLLFGPEGMQGLAEQHPDVFFGPNDALMRALFPPVTADLLTFYLP